MHFEIKNLNQKDTILTNFPVSFFIALRLKLENWLGLFPQLIYITTHCPCLIKVQSKYKVGVIMNVIFEKENQMNKNA